MTEYNLSINNILFHHIGHSSAEGPAGVSGPKSLFLYSKTAVPPSYQNVSIFCGRTHSLEVTKHILLTKNS